MYIYPPKKKKVKGSVPVVDGEYMLLMRLKTDLSVVASQTSLRAYVGHVRMETYTSIPSGHIIVGKSKMAVYGDYGIHGLPLSVPIQVYDQGHPLPPELYDLWNKSPQGSNHERDEMELWGRALRNSDKMKKRKSVCYRCNQPWEGKPLTPCPECSRAIVEKTSQIESSIKRLSDDGAKPPPIILRPEGIPSAERFGKI